MPNSLSHNPSICKRNMCNALNIIMYILSGGEILYSNFEHAKKTNFLFSAKGPFLSTAAARNASTGCGGPREHLTHLFLN